MSLSASKLTLNLTKTDFLLVASRQKLSALPAEIPYFSINMINDRLVKHVSYTEHTQNIFKKIASALGAIK